MAEMVNENAVVIDVGVNRVEDPVSKTGYRLVGDVKFDEVPQKCKAISPVPGGWADDDYHAAFYNTVESAQQLFIL